MNSSIRSFSGISSADYQGDQGRRRSSSPPRDLQSLPPQAHLRVCMPVCGRREKKCGRLTRAASQNKHMVQKILMVVTSHDKLGDTGEPGEAGVGV